MMVTVTHLMFFVLASVTASSDVYKLVNSSVQLDTQDKNVQFEEFKWMFDTKFILKYKKKAELNKFGGYEDRVEFNNKTLSLTLKNLQKNDSGTYVAKAETSGEKIVTQYTLHVLDPVKKPEITSVLHQQSNNTCTITCKGETLSVNSSCSNDTCVGKNATSEGVSLSLYVNGSQIVCNNTNPASWKTTSQEIKKLCSPKSQIDETEHSSSSLPQWTVAIICLFVICLIGICLIIGIRVYHHFIVTHRTPAETPCNTIYEEVQIPNKVKSPENPPEMPEKSEGPTTVYETIGKPTQTSNNKTPNPNSQVQDPPGQV